MSVEATVEQFGLQALDDIKAALAEKWDLLTPEQKASAARAAKRVIELEIKKKTGEDVTDDLEFVKTTIGEFKVAGEIAATSAFQNAFWTGVNKALEALGSFLAGAGKGLIPGL
jgi:hypothetical protein